jgi:hypothetical protein
LQERAAATVLEREFEVGAGLGRDRSQGLTEFVPLPQGL